jgi:hypothetical protein
VEPKWCVVKKKFTYTCRERGKRETGNLYTSYYFYSKPKKKTNQKLHKHNYYMCIKEAGCHCQKLLSLKSQRQNAWDPRDHSLEFQRPLGSSSLCTFRQTATASVGCVLPANGVSATRLPATRIRVVDSGPSSAPPDQAFSDSIASHRLQLPSRRR